MGLVRAGRSLQKLGPGVRTPAQLERERSSHGLFRLGTEHDPARFVSEPIFHASVPARKNGSGGRTNEQTKWVVRMTNALTAINHGAWLLVTARLTAVNIGAVASAGQPISYTPGLHLVGCELDEAELARLRLELQRCRDNRELLSYGVTGAQRRASDTLAATSETG